MDQPEYFPVQAEDIPFFESADGLTRLNVVAGELMGIKGPVKTKTSVNAATAVLRRGARVDVTLPAEHNAFLYILDGKINIAGYGLTEGLHAVVFARDGEGIAMEALDDARVLLLSGEPLNEKVVSHGPFVMNTETQILEAMRDYQKGKMGVLIED
jgi:hypothetical protein